MRTDDAPCPTLEDERYCIMKSCAVVDEHMDCKMSEWSPWTACDVECGTGMWHFVLGSYYMIRILQFSERSCSPGQFVTSLTQGWGKVGAKSWARLGQGWGKVWAKLPSPVNQPTNQIVKLVLRIKFKEVFHFSPQYHGLKQ